MIAGRHARELDEARNASMTSRYSIRRSPKSQCAGFRYPTAAEVAAVLRGKRQADGGYMCRCPCRLHRRGDINPSLSVRDGSSGRPIFNCFAGGDYRDIIDALIARGVWPRWR
jgi:hypothetical protein